MDISFDDFKHEDEHITLRGTTEAGKVFLNALFGFGLGTPVPVKKDTAVQASRFAEQKGLEIGKSNMKLNKFTSDFIKWILRQDDDRPVNMEAPTSYAKGQVGCLMVEYAKELAPQAKWWSCGEKSISTNREVLGSLQISIYDICGPFSGDTFGEMKGKIISKIGRGNYSLEKTA